MVFWLIATPLSAEELRLSYADALQRALSAGTASLLARSSEERARAVVLESRAALLPETEARFLRYNQSINLATFGFSVPGQGPIAGPFNVTDAQITAAMNLFDLASLRRYRAAREGITVSHAQVEQAENDIAAAVGRLYILVDKAGADVEARQANVTLFRELRKLAQDQLAAGTGIRLDVARADVQLAREQQALLVAENQRESGRLALLHAIGADQSSNLVLTDPLAPPEAPPSDAAAAVSAAIASRPELRQAVVREHQAELALSAARAGRYPTLGVDLLGDMSGNRASDLRWSRRVGAGLNVPIFSGGRIEAAIAEAKATRYEAGLQRSETERQIEEEVRRSILGLQSAVARVTVARENVRVAEEEMTVVRDRTANGVGSSIEVDRAEDALREAREDRISAEADAAMAGVELEHSMGTIRARVSAAIPPATAVPATGGLVPPLPNAPAAPPAPAPARRDPAAPTPMPGTPPPPIPPPPAAAPAQPGTPPSPPNG
jgi:outer membrane protein